MCNFLRTVRATLLVVLLAQAQPVCSQSPFSTGDATGSVTIPKGGFLQANFAKDVFRMGYTHELTSYVDRIYKDTTRNAERPQLIPQYGVEVEAKPAGSAAPLFRSGELSVGGKATISVGVSNLLTWRLSVQDLADTSKDQGWGPLTFDWVSLRLSYARNQYNVLDPSASFSSQIARKEFDGFGALLSYNAQFGGKLPGVLGIAIGVDQTNNADDLQQVEIQDEVFSSSSGSTQRTARTTRKVLRGDFEESNTANLNTDLVVLPPPLGARIAFDLFTRTDLSEANPTVRPGLGVFLTQADAPTKVIGGVSFYRDREGGLGVDLIAGFNFE